MFFGKNVDKLDISISANTLLVTFFVVVFEQLMLMGNIYCIETPYLYYTLMRGYEYKGQKTSYFILNKSWRSR